MTNYHLRSLLRPSRALTVAGAAMALVAAGGCASSIRPNSPTNSGDCTSRAALVSVVNILPDGSAAPIDAPKGKYATKYTYRLDGTLLSEVRPPAGWSPVTATDQELRTYGLPARPHDPTQRATWDREFSSWKFNITSGMCETGKRS